MLRSKHNIYYKSLSCIMIFTLLFVCCPISKADTKEITSFGSSGNYFWKWNKITSREELLATGIDKSETNKALLYRAIITANNPKSTKNFMVTNYSASGTSLKMTSRTDDSAWFDDTCDCFVTATDNGAPLIQYINTTTSGTAKRDNFYFCYPQNTITYTTSGGGVSFSSLSYKGIENDGDRKWKLTSGTGEGWGIAFPEEGGTGYNDPEIFGYMYDYCHIIESGNEKYHWACGDDYIYDTKDGYGKTCDGNFLAESFGLWIGKWTNLPGISSGNYSVTAGNTIEASADATVICSGATLKIEKGATLVVTGNLYVYGGLVNEGTIIVADGGALIVGVQDTSTVYSAIKVGYMGCNQNSTSDLDENGSATLSIARNAILKIEEMCRLTTYANTNLSCDGTIYLEGNLYMLQSDFYTTAFAKICFRYGTTYQESWLYMNGCKVNDNATRYNSISQTRVIIQ